MKTYIVPMFLSVTVRDRAALDVCITKAQDACQAQHIYLFMDEAIPPKEMPLEFDYMDNPASLQDMYTGAELAGETLFTEMGAAIDKQDWQAVTDIWAALMNNTAGEAK